MSIKSEVSPKASNKQSLVALAKGVLIEQHQRLTYKNNVELEILEDLYKFLKSRCQIETHYNQQMVKLATHHLQRKQVPLRIDPHCEEKALYPAWRGYLCQTERCCKDRLTHFEQMVSIVDQLKQIKTRKHQIVKKTMDTYFKKAQDDVLASLSELDKCRKLYFDEEHYANQARDKEEKIKKRKYGILSKFTDMQSKKEKSSAQKEASEIQSTMARNEYIMSLAAANAHLQHYFNVELSYLLDILEDNTIDNCKDILIQLIDKEEQNQQASASALKDCLDYLQKVTASYTHIAFLTDGANTSLSERLQIDFEPCENDTVTDVSLEHNAAFALEHEVTKWQTCFCKETRNLAKIDQQLTKCFKLQAAGKKQVEVNGIGQMDLDQRIEDLKLQKRKCDLNKCKAKARLLVLKKGGLNVDDLDTIELQITNEIEEQFEKQQKDKQMLNVNQGGDESLSRTSSLRSTVSPDLGRISVMENKSQSEERQEFNDTPEPLSSENDLSEDHAQQYQQTWTDYDPTAAWSNANDQQLNQELDQQQYDDYSNQEDLINQYVIALYAYSAQNEDELDIVEGEQLLVVSVDEKDWIKVENSNGKSGYVPFAYVESINKQTQYDQQQTELNMQDNNLADSQYSNSIIQSSSPAPAFYSETQTTYSQQYAYQDENYQDTTITQESYQETYTASEDQPAVDQTVAFNKKEDNRNYAIAAYDYDAENNEEISFKEGDTIEILEKSDDGWWLGINKEGQTGHFPSMLVHCDEDEEEEIEEEEINIGEEELDSDSELPEFELPGLPPLPSLPPPPELIEDDDEDEGVEEINEQEEKPIKPTTFLTQPDTGIVITEATPDVEHKPIIQEDEEKEDTIEKENQEEEEKVQTPVKQNYVPTTVEINVFESEKQVFSSDEDEEPVKKEEPINEEEEKAVTNEEEIELPEKIVKVQVELNNDELPPPPQPSELAFSPDDDKEDDELIIKKLKQLKDTNNNFTASFDILDDSELTTAENSQSLEEKAANETKDENKDILSNEEDLNKVNNENKDKDNKDTKNKDNDNKDTDNKETENKETENKETESIENQNKNESQQQEGFANFETNFNANFEANFPDEDEDLK